MTPQPIPNRPSQFQIDNQWLEFYEPALKYGAKIDSSQIIGDSVINIEDSGLPFGSFGTLDFVAFTLVDNGDGSVSIQSGPGSGVILQEDGTPLSASPFVTLNFVGATLTDDGGAVSTITIAASGSTINWATVNWTNFFNDVDWSDFTDWSTFVTSLTTNWTAGDWDTFTSTFTSNLSSTEVIDILDQAPGSADNDVFLWDNTAGEWTIGPIPGGGGGSGISESVTQVAHGFIVGDVIKSAGTDNVFAKAQANSEVNAEALGIVTAVADVDNFTYAKDLVGYAGAGIPAGTPGEAVWLSPTVAGAMTATKPTAVGQVQKPLGQITASGTAMNFTADMRGEIITSATSGATGMSLSNNQSYNIGIAPFPEVALEDENYIFTCSNNGDATDFVINKYTRDALTGTIVYDTSVGITGATSLDDATNFCQDEDNLYIVFFDDSASTYEVKKWDKVTLTQSTLTLSGFVSPTIGNPFIYDGLLYVAVLAGNYVGGTIGVGTVTATATTIPITPTGSNSLFEVGSSLYRTAHSGSPGLRQVQKRNPATGAIILTKTFTEAPFYGQDYRISGFSLAYNGAVNIHMAHEFDATTPNYSVIIKPYSIF